MKKSSFLRPATFIITGAVLAAVIAYIRIGALYNDVFYPGTFVNHVYSTGKTIPEVNDELVKVQQNDTLFITVEGERYDIAFSAFDYSLDYTEQIKEVLHKQNPMLWGIEIWNPVRVEISPKYTYSEEKLQKAIEETGIFARYTKEPTVKIVKTDCFELFDGMQHTLSKEKAIAKIKESVDAQNYTVDISDCFENLPYTAEMQSTLLMWEKVDDFQTSGVVFDMGDKRIAIDKQIAAGFLLQDGAGNFPVDEKGYPLADEEAIRAFVTALCERFDTYGKPHAFTTTDGREISVEGGTYGNKLHYEAEVEYLLSVFSGENQKNEKEEVHIPKYEQEAYVRGADDIGDTYVEVDMGNQKLYFYKDGELLIETDVVTGNMRRKCNTPSGVNYVYFMQRNRTLRGPDYETPVAYWMAVNGHIGLHDAGWRRAFGGEIYKTNGSHGCVNIPKKKAAELYGLIEVGVPVVMFYE